jgi:hypothetical protein
VLLGIFGALFVNLVFEDLLEVDEGWDMSWSADLTGGVELVVSILSNLGLVFFGLGAWITVRSIADVNVVHGPEHDTTEVAVRDVVNDFFINIEAFPDTSGSLVSWLETHNDLLLVLRLCEVIQDNLILL